jgi:CheY-like chemotaxis protein
MTATREVGCRILIVLHEEESREELVNALRDAGHDVLGLVYNRQACELLDQDYDVLICCCSASAVGDLPGRELVERARAQALSTIVIVLDLTPTDAFRSKALELGVFECMDDFSDIDGLVKAIARGLAFRKAAMPKVRISEEPHPDTGTDQYIILECAHCGSAGKCDCGHCTGLQEAETWLERLLRRRAVARCSICHGVGRSVFWRPGIPVERRHLSQLDDPASE